MSNIKQALESAIDLFDKSGFIEEHEIQAVREQCKSALAELEKREPVAEAIRERDRLGFAVVNVIGKLDEIIENTQEVEVDDFLHIAISIDMWNELQDALEDMPKRAELYTSPQTREWVGLSDEAIFEMCPYIDHDLLEEAFYRGARAVEDKLRELNTKG